MNPRPLLAILGLQVVFHVAGASSSTSFLCLSLLSSLVLLSSERDFESMAAELNRDGTRASAPSMVFGKSGVKHEFSFGLTGASGTPKVVVDTELSVKEVEEMKVLKFYVKVFDVSPTKAILCVSPRLSDKARQLAEEYGITVIEDEVPRNLIPLARKEVMSLLSRGS